MQENDTLLSLRNISKYYPGVTALSNFSLDIKKGEIHAIVGENGAGKSTLIEIIAGAQSPDNGEIVFCGSKYSHLNPHIARELGIQVIYQNFNLVLPLSVAENIFQGDLPGNGFFIDKKTMVQKTKSLFKNLNANIDPHTPVKELSTAHQQIVEIAKAVSKNVKVLIMDEPSAALTSLEIEPMFEIVRTLNKKGVTVIYISHRLEEIFTISNRVTILRDGFYIDTKHTNKTTRRELINLMVGREFNETYPKRNSSPKETIFKVENISGKGFNNISFSVKKGEVLGIFGLVGAGRTELARGIFGVEPIESGQMILDGENIKIKKPSDAIKNGIGLIPEDRRQHGVILNASVKHNISLPKLKSFCRSLFIDKKKEEKKVAEYEKSLLIKTPTLNQKVLKLSGGNQQKVVLAKWLLTDSRVLIFDEPTRGIDVGAKQEIYKLMNKLVESGVAIIMISSELQELIGMSDRIIVFCEGDMTGELNKSDFKQEMLLDYAFGNR